MASPTTMTASTTAATGTVHCAPDALLLAFATGSLNEPLSLLVESHAALNPVSRRRLCEYEAIGGALLEELPPAPLCPEAWEATLERLGEESGGAAIRFPACGCSQRPRDGFELPAALRRRVGDDLGALCWKRRLRGLSESEIGIGDGGRVALMRIEPGGCAPRHAHRGHEFTLVLAGAFRDGATLFRLGDLQISGPEVEHQPEALDEGPCLCLVVTDAPVRLTGRLGRLLNPFLCR